MLLGSVTVACSIQLSASLHKSTGVFLSMPMRLVNCSSSPSHSAVIRLATFYSRSRKGRWCKGETSGHFINVTGVYVDCDADSLIYLGEPIGPACHTVHASSALHLRLLNGLAGAHQHSKLCMSAGHDG